MRDEKDQVKAVRGSSRSKRSSVEKTEEVVKHTRIESAAKQDKKRDISETPKEEEKEENRVLYEVKTTAPAPSQTYLQMIVEKDKVVLRDWPMKRHSQRWSRDGHMNPGEKVLSKEEFKQSREDLLPILGQEYEKALKVLH